MEKDKNHLSINITPGSFFKAILLVLLLWFLFAIKDILLVVLVAIIIASGLEPLVHWFKRFKISRVPAAIISYVALAAIFTVLMISFVPTVLDETSVFLTTLPQYLDSTALWNPLNITSSDITVPQKVAQGLSDGINSTGQIVRDVTTSQTKTSGNSLGIADLISGIQTLTSNTQTGLITIISTVFGGLLSFVLIVVLSFYFLVQEDGVAKFLGLVTPIKNEKYVVDLWKRSQKKIGQWMQGQLLLGVLVAVFVYLGLVILGMKNALLLALLSGLLEIIPIFGPVIAAIPAVLSAFIDGGVTAAFLVTGLYIIIQQFESHLIYPLVVRKIVGVSPILVILALLIGAKLAGFLGIVLAVPLISALMEFVEDIEKRKTMFWQKARETENI